MNTTLFSDTIRGTHLNRLQEILAEYGATKLIARGGHAEIYEIDAATVLRIEYDYGGRLDLQSNREINMREIQKVLSRMDIIPKIHAFKLYAADDMRPKYGWFSATKMERLDILNWSEWRTVFSEHDLIVRLFNVYRRLLDAGILHRDATMNNIVLTRSGSIKMIDFDDTCLANTTEYNNSKMQIQFCQEPPGQTPGFYDPRVHLLDDDDNVTPAQTAQFQMLKKLFPEYDIGTIVKPVKEWTAATLRQAMIFSAGASLLSIITGKDPLAVDHSDISNLSKDARIAIRTAMDLNLDNRKLVSIKLVANTDIIERLARRGYPKLAALRSVQSGGVRTRSRSRPRKEKIDGCI